MAPAEDIRDVPVGIPGVEPGKRAACRHCHLERPAGRQDTCQLRQPRRFVDHERERVTGVDVPDRPVRQVQPWFLYIRAYAAEQAATVRRVLDEPDIRAPLPRLRMVNIRAELGLESQGGQGGWHERRRAFLCMASTSWQYARQEDIPSCGTVFARHGAQ